MVDVSIGGVVAVNVTAGAASADVGIGDHSGITVTSGTADAVSVTAGCASADVRIGDYTEVIYTNAPAYEGSYTVTPGASMQTLLTAGKRMTDNITINPVPSNYGRIEWNGAFLKIV